MIGSIFGVGSTNLTSAAWKTCSTNFRSPNRRRRAGERLDYLRGFMHQTELAVAQMPTAWAALRNGEAAGAGDIRPRMIHTDLLKNWEFVSAKAGNELPVENLLDWAQE